MKVSDDKPKRPMDAPGARVFEPEQKRYGRVMLFEKIPEDLRIAFKRACVGREPMRHAIIRLMKFYVAVRGKVPKIPGV